MAAELWGLHDGLTLARNLNIRKLLVEVNASVVANFFSADYSMQDTTHPFSAITIDCRFLLSLFEEVHLKHIHREGNQCADLLAKEGHRSHLDFVIHPHPPDCIKYQLMVDSWVLFTPAFVIFF